MACRKMSTSPGIQPTRTTASATITIVRAPSIYHPLGWELDYNYPSNGAGPYDSNADMVFNGWGGPYNLWGPVHYGGEVGSFLFAGMHVETVRIDVWATSPLMWGSYPSPGGTRTIPGWDYELYE